MFGCHTADGLLIKLIVLGELIVSGIVMCATRTCKTLLNFEWVFAGPDDSFQSGSCQPVWPWVTHKSLQCCFV